MRERTFTKKELDWLRENYPTSSDYKIRTHLHMGQGRLQMLVEEMGLEKEDPEKFRNKIPVEGKVKVKVDITRDEGAPGGVCMDCDYYKIGGICGRTGKEICALWKKRCFTKHLELSVY